MDFGPGEASSSQESVFSDAQSLGPAGGDDGEVDDGEVGDGEVGGPSVNLGQCKKRGKRKKKGFSKHKKDAKSQGQEDAFRRKKVTDKIENCSRTKYKYTQYSSSNIILLKISCVLWRGAPIEVKKQSFLSPTSMLDLSLSRFPIGVTKTEIFCLAFFSSHTCVAHPEQNKYELPVGDEQSKTARTRMITSLMATSIMLLLFMGVSPTQAGKCHGEGCQKTPEYPTPASEKECPKGECIIQLVYFCRQISLEVISVWLYLSLFSLREGLNEKKTVFFRHCPNHQSSIHWHF